MVTLRPGSLAAGDVFHGAFCYGLLQDWPIRDILDFSNAMAALNCTAIGARGGISTLDQARNLLQRTERRTNRAYLTHSAHQA